MNAHVAVERRDVAVHRTEDVEGAPGNRDRTVDGRVRRDGPVTDREMVGVGKVRIADSASLRDFLGDPRGVTVGALYSG